MLISPGQLQCSENLCYGKLSKKTLSRLECVKSSGDEKNNIAVADSYPSKDHFYRKYQSEEEEQIVQDQTIFMVLQHQELMQYSTHCHFIRAYKEGRFVLRNKFIETIFVLCYIEKINLKIFV